ncbi:hypothetical protein CBL_03463 [Carabus blaptoides fortunei]
MATEVVTLSINWKHKVSEIDSNRSGKCATDQCTLDRADGRGGKFFSATLPTTTLPVTDISQDANYKVLSSTGRLLSTPPPCPATAGIITLPGPADKGQES